MLNAEEPRLQKANSQRKMEEIAAKKQVQDAIIKKKKLKNTKELSEKSFFL